MGETGKKRGRLLPIARRAREPAMRSEVELALATSRNGVHCTSHIAVGGCCSNLAGTLVRATARIQDPGDFCVRVNPPRRGCCR